ncbi:serine hydrolase [Zeaxanthinibacter sp. PT1]|uniref:serine hydrolase domain-containing protein n=1 Tax=Zeaxanthinibacter TaxID=561554 RepID=UPI00234A8176|nr:serine hydrolase domain-containing protein [Zeaxanthinibacter sp. PT1]MDC6349998.1 serine hydrolase [Zeaxanthinibacter sp. PT1]
MKTAALFDGLVKNAKVPGLALKVQVNGKEVLEKGFGLADIATETPVDPAQTVFRVASISKPIAATALMQLVSEGKIGLDNSLYDYLPYYPEKQYDFTIRQLASHTAGIRAYKGKEYALNKPNNIEQGLAVFKDDPLIFEPGKGYQYNSFDWALLSRVMEVVSGMPFSDYVKARVLDPLGMQNTIPEIPGHLPQSAATFYTRNFTGFRKAVPVDNRYKLAGGGYLSTAADIALLGEAYRSGSLSDTALQSEFLSSMSVKGKPTHYGLGWEVSRDKEGRAFYGHTGNSVGAYSLFRIYPEEGVVLVILINCTNPGVEAQLEEGINAIFRDLNPMA